MSAWNRLTLYPVALVGLHCFAVGALCALPPFKEHVINAEADVVPAVAVADLNRDGKLDIIGVSNTHVTWYENPSWTPHRIADQIKGLNVCIAAYDLDEDGSPELALGADWQFDNTDSGGALYLLKSGPDPTQPWTQTTLVEEDPTLHRIRWADVDGDGHRELVVAPLKGRGSKPPLHQESGVRLYLLRPGADPFRAPWEEEVIDESLHVLHNLWPTPSGEGRDAILTASFEGITQFNRHTDGKWSRTLLAGGNPELPPNSGAGEVKTGKAGLPVMATIEPWHGTQAVIYAHCEGQWLRHVVDNSFRGGHAVWWADFDGDGDDELLAGFRDNAGPKQIPGLSVYDVAFDAAGREITVKTRIVDDGGMATEDACAADVNGDGKMDIVAGGRATHNIKYYENLGDSK